MDTLKLYVDDSLPVATHHTYANDHSSSPHEAFHLHSGTDSRPLHNLLIFSDCSTKHNEYMKHYIISTHMRRVASFATWVGGVMLHQLALM